MYTKKNSRVTFRSNRRSNYKRNNNFSNNKSRNKGNVTQQYNKYLKLAKEASSSGDRIQSEYFYQFTDHYYRVMMEMGITFEDQEVSSASKSSDETDTLNNDTNDQVSENSKVEKNNSNDEIESSNDDEDIESIQSVPFIAEPIKKKPSKSKKEIA